MRPKYHTSKSSLPQLDQNHQRLIMYPSFIRYLLAICAVVLLVQCKSSSDSDPDDFLLPELEPISDNFVTAENANFMVDGNVYRYSGTNAYYLQNYQQLDPAVVDNAFNLFAQARITVVRMWAFYDGFDCSEFAQNPGENIIQTAPGIYNEQALQDLDEIIAKGRNQGIRFILTLTNYWDDHGGICQYNTWDGAADPSLNMSYFINDPDTQQWYRDYIAMLLNRINTVTGVAYKDDPAIFAWEIIGEGRIDDGDPTELRNWYQEIAQYIKSIDTNHMVSTGEEGLEVEVSQEYSIDEYSNLYVLRSNRGTSYRLNTAIPEIDYGTAHWYPSDYGFGFAVNDEMLDAQQAWINDHARIAQDLGRPFLLGEYGFPGYGDNRVVAVYQHLWNLAEEIRLDGSLIWQLTADYAKCFEYGGNICYPGGRSDQELFNQYLQHTSTIQSLN